MDQIYNQPVIINHTKAKKFCETEIYIEEGAKEDLIDMVTTKILKTPGHYTLKDLMQDFGVSFAHSEPKDGIGILEAIYDVLNSEKIKSFIQEQKLLDNNVTTENLFCEAFDNMYKTAIRYRNKDLLNHLQTYLEPEIMKEQDGSTAVGISGETENTGDYST